MRGGCLRNYGRVRLRLKWSSLLENFFMIEFQQRLILQLGILFRRVAHITVLCALIRLKTLHIFSSIAMGRD